MANITQEEDARLIAAFKGAAAAMDAKTIDKHLMESYKAGLLGGSMAGKKAGGTAIRGKYIHGPLTPYAEFDETPKLHRFETQKDVIKAIYPRIVASAELYKKTVAFLEGLVDEVVALTPVDHVLRNSFFELDTRNQVVTVFMSTHHVGDTKDVLTVNRTKSYAHV